MEGADPETTIICGFSPHWPMNTSPYCGHWTLFKYFVLLKIINNFLIYIKILKYI